MKAPEFRFQSLQNWQSEFLAIGSMVVLSIFLREKIPPNQNPSKPRMPKLAASLLQYVRTKLDARRCSTGVFANTPGTKITV
ncbi:MAG TPA: DUF6766 family protein [Verrucomicrobiae bacterium]|nr:DUF6766 family protein [Verrucomicrobiae bacterium]